MKTLNNEGTMSSRNPRQAKRVAYTIEVTESPSYGSRVNFGKVISFEKALTIKLTRGGPWELLVGVPDANRDRWTRRRLQVCLVPSSGSFWDVNT